MDEKKSVENFLKADVKIRDELIEMSYLTLTHKPKDISLLKITIEKRLISTLHIIWKFSTYLFVS